VGILSLAGDYAAGVIFGWPGALLGLLLIVELFERSLDRRLLCSTRVKVGLAAVIVIVGAITTRPHLSLPGNAAIERAQAVRERHRVKRPPSTPSSSSATKTRSGGSNPKSTAFARSSRPNEAASGDRHRPRRQRARARSARAEANESICVGRDPNSQRSDVDRVPTAGKGLQQDDGRNRPGIVSSALSRRRLLLYFPSAGQRWLPSRSSSLRCRSSEMDPIAPSSPLTGKTARKPSRMSDGALRPLP
jgi:hypothetical protein